MWKNANQFLVGNENNDVWADLNGSGSLTTRYIRGDVIDQIFSRIDSGTNYWELTDRLGSVRDVINNSAVIKDTIGYNGFGGITSETDSSFRGRYAWTGREIDTEINLQYNRARYYNAATGRWISQDPLGFDAGDSNLYRYVRNIASNATDSSGLQISDAWQSTFIFISEKKRVKIEKKVVSEKIKVGEFKPKTVMDGKVKVLLNERSTTFLRITYGFDLLQLKMKFHSDY